jgi:hypothetical protein
MTPGIPEILLYNPSEKYNFLVMQLLGSSLDELFVKNNKQFTLKTVLMLADAM